MTKRGVSAAMRLPMLCGSSMQECPRRDSPLARWAAEPKIDGWRAMIHWDGSSVSVFSGRNGSDHSGKLPYLEEEMARILPPNTVLDGELYSSDHDLGWGHVQSVMGSRGAHLTDDPRRQLSFYLFDAPRWDGIDLFMFPYRERRGLLEVFRRSCVSPDHCDIVPVFESTPEVLDRVLRVGFEGLVLKNPASRYASGRSSDWVKIKPQEPADATIVGFKPGKGRWLGMVGAFIVRLEKTGKETTASCGTDAMHISATQHPERWLGRRVELRHHGWQPSGKVRSPQIHRVRDDL